MKPLIIESTKFTPKIQFIPEENLFEISGFSLPENVTTFFAPVIKWLDEYREWLNKNKSATQNEFNVRFNLTYFNSGSLRFFINIMKKILIFKEQNVKINVLWHFDRDDMEIKDSGAEISGIVDFPFEFIEN